MSDGAKKRPRYAVGFGLACAFLGGALVGGCLSHGLTGIAIQNISRHKQYEDERDEVAPAIAKDPAFKDIDICEYSGGGSRIVGSVPTTADKKRLQELVIRALGERGAERVVKVRARDERK
jgi:hypothetical protein